MEQCACVERELEKVLHRFVAYGHQSEERLDELLRNVCELRSQLVTFGKCEKEGAVIHSLAILIGTHRTSEECGKNLMWQGWLCQMGFLECFTHC